MKSIAAFALQAGARAEHSIFSSVIISEPRTGSLSLAMLVLNDDMVVPSTLEDRNSLLFCVRTMLRALI